MGPSGASQSRSCTGADESGIPARPFPTLLPEQQVGHQAKYHQPSGTGAHGQARRGTGLYLQHLLRARHFACITQLTLQSHFHHLLFIDEETEAQRN